MHGFDFIQDLAIVLVAGGVAGWACQRLGLSAIAGFLAAGMLVGPHAPAVTLVRDAGRIETLAQVGLVFLMFGIGLSLSLRRLRRLGLGLMAGTVAASLLVYSLSRCLALAMGWSAMEGVFLAGMLMISSSAIIARVLRETGVTHEKSGQLAMGVVVAEDVVAVGLLTMLSAVARFGGVGGGEGVPEAVVRFGAFVALAGIGGLLLVPWLLRRMSRAVSEELQTPALTGLLFGVAAVAQAAGYSPALGAFLLGLIVAETAHRHQVERVFEGMRDVFGVVFFVAIGMQIDARDLWREAWAIAGIAVFTVAARSGAVTTGLCLIGTPFRDAARTGLMTTPIGEFSFVIAQIGVGAMAVPGRFYPIAVGVSLLTTLGAPVLTRRAETLAGAAEARLPRGVAEGLGVYRGWLERVRRMGASSLWWRLSRKRLAQVGVGMLFVTGLAFFSGRLFGEVERWVSGKGGEASGVWQFGFWSVLALVAIAPLVAIWRNLSAVALIGAEVSTQGHRQAGRLRPVVETGLKVGFGGVLYLWLAAILPAEGARAWVWLAGVPVAGLALLAWRRKLILWHSEAEAGILSAFESEEGKMSVSAAPWLQSHGEWRLQMIDCTLPDLADCQGRTIAELKLRTRLGCTVVGIERQGFMIPLPGPEVALYPRDRILLMGTSEQVRAGRAFLTGVTGTASDSVFGEVQMEAVVVPGASRAVGRTLAALSPAQSHGVQIAGVRRGERRILNPGAEVELQAGDEILVLGPPAQIRGFKAWLAERAESEA